MALKEFKRDGDDRVALDWDDGHSGPVSLRFLRDSCPCAECRGETVLLKEFKPKPPRLDTPGRYELKAVVPVGNYAIQLFLDDTATTEIYTWDHLRSLCECDSCREHRQS